MPFAGYKGFEDCEKKNQDKQDPSGFCAWLKRKVEGGDPLVLSLEANSPEMLYPLYRLEAMASSKLSMKLLTREDALAALEGDDIWKKAPDAVVNDDHRWIHVWAKTVERGDQLFISKAQLKRLHDLVVDEMARRGMDSGISHKSPLHLALLSGDRVTAFLKNRQGFLLDPEFINLIGSSVAGKENPGDLDILFRSSRDSRFAEAFSRILPKDLEADLVWDPIGPNGPYVPAFELWAIPVKNPIPKEPKYTIQPMSPIVPAKPTRTVDRNSAPSLFEDSYFVEPINGMRVMIHRRENHLMAFDPELEEVEIPKEIAEELSKIKDPPTFILDGFLTREKGEAVYNLIDLPWWRESEHVRQTAETRKYFISKLLKEIPEAKHIRRNEAKYFPNRRDTVDFLKEENGPYLLIPGLTIYPVEGTSDWALFESGSETYKLAESADETIKSKVDAGEWEKMDADARFTLMTKRKRIEPLYPFAQMKTTKKGYSAREVFGLTSVNDLAKDLFRVPNKQATEVKIDGFRTEIHKKGDQVRLFTESGHEITQQLPTIVKDIQGLPGNSFVLDSEATPYSEDLTNLGRAGAAPAFAMGAKGPVDDKLWALHVFDILYLNGEDLHDLPYEERRQRLRGIELPTRDVPKEKSDFRLHLWENNVYWATSAEQMVKLAEQVSDTAGSEGAMFKQADSKYRLSGNTPLWSKMKRTFEIDAIVVGMNREGDTYNYVGAVGPVDAKADVEAPVDSPKGRKFVKFKGKVYSILGKTFNTNIKAPIGGIIRVTVKDIGKIDDKVYHWFHPQVLEAREDKTRPDPLETAQTISESAKAQQRVRKAAFLSSARFAEESPIKCCLSPWVALEAEEGWQYLENNAALPSSLKQLGVEVLYASGMDRDLAERLLEAGISFDLTEASTIADFRHSAYAESNWPPDSVALDPGDLRAFESSVWSHPDFHMKLECGSGVPMAELNPLKLADPYVTYPDESKKWEYVVQFHIRGLSVHADFRAEINERQLIGWTWNLGKSLIKPLLRRVSDETLSKTGLTKGQLKDMEISEVSAKLRSTKEGKELIEKLSQRTQDLPYGELERIANEVWEEEAKPILENPNMKILTERKAPEPHEWLDYKGEIPAGAVGATAELEGVFIIMDKGDVQFGTQKPWFHEYFLKGKRINGKMVVRQLPTRKEWKTKQSFAWLTFFTKPGDMPYVISRRAIQQDWMPPQGVSSLPREVRDQIPKDRQYWRAKNTKEIRDELVKEIGGKKVTLRLAKGLQFAVKRVWHKGPEVQRGTPIVRYWILLHDGSKVIDAWDFGEDSDPTEEAGLLVRRRSPKGFEDLLPTTGELPATHPASYTKKLPNNFDTSDQGKAEIVSDENDMLRIRLSGERLKGLYVFLKRDPSGEGWIFQRAELPEPKKAMLLQASTCETGVCSTTHIMHLSAKDFKYEKIGNLLFLNGPAIKPGEVIPMDGKPSRFTKEGIKKIWPSMYRQPIVVLHGDLKGDVIGFVDEIHYDEMTGWGWIDRGVIWHPLGMKLIMEGKLPAFSIEVIPESVWDPEHQHDIVMGGQCVGLAVVPKGACVTCNYKEAIMGELVVRPHEIYKFGMTLENYLQELYWNQGLSTQAISNKEGIPRSTVEHHMKQCDLPRRSYPESRQLRSLRENEARKFGGRVKITALGTGAFTDIPRDDCPQCQEARSGGKSKRNYTATLFSVGNEHLLINTPKGVAGMLGLKQVKPKYVLIEHIHEDVIGGLHELKALRPNVFASAEIWAWLRDHHQAASGQKGNFEDIYDFPRYVIKGNQGFSIADSFTVTPHEIGHAKEGDPSAYGFKIDLGGKKVWHSSDVLSIPNHKKLLGDIDLYIGDGASLTRGIPGGEEHGHASMEDQIKWAKEAEVQKVYFTQIGHVGMSHDQLRDKLAEMAPNAEPMHDGMEVSLSGAAAGTHMPEKAAQELLSGQRKILVRSKPYSEYARQVILLIGDKVHGLFIEGFPEGPLDAAKVRELKDQHRMTDAEWKKEIGDAKKVWIYHPRVLRRFEPPRDYQPAEPAGPYIHDVKMVG